MSFPIIGAHVSASGGIDKAIARAADIGCNCVQIFSGSPRVWAKPALDKHPVTRLHAEQQRLGVTPVVTHALYLINLASDKPESVQKSITSLIYELQFDGLIGGAGVVVHLGSHQGRGWEAVKHQVADAIREILAKTPDNSMFLIENSAGQNGKLCSDLSEIRWLLDTVNSPRLGWCLDTCHAHAAGYALGVSPRSVGETLKSAISGHERGVPTERGENLTATITRLNLWETLRVVHVNDSRDPFDSGRDRHANLGDGTILPSDLKTFVNTPQLQHLPLILEVPGIDGNGPDAENVERLKNMVE